MSSGENGLTYFSVHIVQFPDLEDNKLDTVKFLNSSRSVVKLIESFGKTFTPVKYDMNGNINKLNKKYQECPEKYKYLNDMVLSEKEKGEIIATDALQWLRRALQFILRIFQCIQKEHEKGTCDHNISKYSKIAYADTLERYHGWMAQQLFKLVVKTCPSYDHFLKIFTLGQNVDVNQIFNDMAVFTTRLNKCVQHLVEFYQVYELEVEDRV